MLKRSIASLLLGTAAFILCEWGALSFPDPALSRWFDQVTSKVLFLWENVFPQTKAAASAPSDASFLMASITVILAFSLLVFVVLTLAAPRSSSEPNGQVVSGGEA